MKPFQRFVIALAGLSLIGCASWMAPSEQSMAQVPVVRFGSAAPAGKDFVMLYPAGTPLPVVASVGGTLMEQGDKATLHATLKRDVYVYKHWVSFDGKNWEYGRHAIKGKFEIKLPGMENGSNPGALGLEFNTK
jgi:hypothetical protein